MNLSRVQEKLKLVPILPLLLLVLLLPLKSVPITDDYCFAFGSQEYGVWRSFFFWNQSWSPSLGYIFPIIFWGLPIPLTTASSLLSYLAIISLFSTIFLFSRKVFVKSQSHEFTMGVMTIAFALLTIALIPANLVWEFHARPTDPLRNLAKIALSSLKIKRDGELLQWVAAAPITFAKVVLTSILILLILRIAQNSMQQKSLAMVTLGIAFVIGFGASTEQVAVSILGILLLVDRLIRRVKINSWHWLNICVIGTSILFLTRSTGSQYRQEQFASLNLQLLVQRSSTLFFQISLILLISLSLSILFIFLMHRLKMPLELSNYLEYRRSAGMVFASVLIANLVVGLTVYISVYHWISLSVISFLAFVIFFVNSVNNFSMSLEFGLTKRLLLCAVVMTGLLGTNTVYQTFRTVDERRLDWIKRHTMPKEEILYEVPMIDNFDRIIAHDMKLGMKAIIPGRGFVVNGANKCYEGIRGTR